MVLFNFAFKKDSLKYILTFLVHQTQTDFFYHLFTPTYSKSYLTWYLTEELLQKLCIEKTISIFKLFMLFLQSLQKQNTDLFKIRVIQKKIQIINE